LSFFPSTRNQAITRLSGAVAPNLKESMIYVPGSMCFSPRRSSCSLSSPSFAGLTFSAGNNPQPDEENILLTSGDSGTVIRGRPIRTGAAVDFSSTTDIPRGSVERPGAHRSAGWRAQTNITISTPGGVTYMDFIGNPFNGTGTMKLTVVTDQNIYVFDPALTLGNGQNFLHDRRGWRRKSS
jgi:hypothetical protein